MQKLTVGIIDARPQAQPPLKSAPRQGIEGPALQLLIQKLRHQSPGLGRRRLLKSPLHDGGTLLHRPIGGKCCSPPPAGSPGGPGFTATQQHLGCQTILAKALKMVSQKVEGNPTGGVLAFP